MVRGARVHRVAVGRHRSRAGDAAVKDDLSVSWWSMRDIEIELGTPVADAEQLIALRDLRAQIETVGARIKALAPLMDAADGEAQEAIIERGERPDQWWLPALD
jgi:hypothetical protein